MQLEGEKVGAVVPGDVVEHAVAADAQLAGLRCRREDHVEEVPRARLDRLADEHETADAHDQARLLEQLTGGGVDQRLAGLHPAAGKQPVAATVLDVLGEQDPPVLADADRHPDAHGGVAHAGIIAVTAPGS